MGRKRNNETGLKGGDPTCPNLHTLKRLTADGDFECDSCHADISDGCCYYGCNPCDYSLCGSCYVKLATGTLESNAEKDDPHKINPDVAELCDHYEVEDRIMLILNEVMKGRKDTFDNDIFGLWEILRPARSPAGLLMAKIREMKEGTFVYTPPPKDVKRIIQTYHLDEDARTKLTDFICKRPDTAEKDLYEIERRLENSGKPSAIVMTMIVCLQKGKPLPEIRHNVQSHRDYAENSSYSGPRGSNKYNDQERRGRSRSRDYDRDRDKARGSDRRGRSRSRDYDRGRDRERW